MTNDKKVAAFILTHGRANNMYTDRYFRRAGWTRPIYYIIDNEDDQADLYRQTYGEENVIQFDKERIGHTFDMADTQQDRRTITFARNACFEIAAELGYDYHIQLDDDYVNFYYRKEVNNRLETVPIRSMNKVVDALIDFLETSNATAVAMAQAGDHIGGIGGIFSQPVKRKAMNSFVMKTSKPVTFIGRMNEDVNTYVTLGSRGQLFFTMPKVSLCQKATQTNEGGMSDFYKETGTYVKSFTTVMMAPSSVIIRQMGPVGKRLHHRILWNKAVPKIISDQHKK